MKMVIKVGVGILLTGLVCMEGRAMTILEDTLRVENDQSVRKSVTVATVKYEPVSAVYVVRGRVRYENVEGEAYLELWNVMPDGSRYFSRTLGDSGPMRKIRGSSDWRAFELPFNLMDARPESVTLEVNVVMPGKGVIEVSGVSVGDVQGAGVKGDEWWSEREGGIVGGVLGCIGGLFGALVGCLCGILVPRGKGKRWVLGLAFWGIAVSVAMLIGGVTALCLGQPYHVWYPLVLFGGIMVFSLSFCLPAVYRGYAQAERRRMEALDM